jgi:hypothetical protein
MKFRFNTLKLFIKVTHCTRLNLHPDYPQQKLIAYHILNIHFPANYFSAQQLNKIVTNFRY